MSLAPHVTTRRLLERLLESPDLPRTIQVMPPRAFSALVRKVGVEDAGELVALATTAQLVAAFDEDLFVGERPGAREELSGHRFATWLEVLLEAGADAAADRVAELSEDFLAHALGSLVRVLDHDALLERLAAGGRAARRADKALESSLTEELDGWLLVSKGGEGWDAALALVLALDSKHRALLERVLDRCAAASAEALEDLDELATALDSEASLAEDVEAEREERRGRQGFVEPRAARAFLELAKRPMTEERRDPLTAAYFRDLDPGDGATPPAEEEDDSARRALPDPGVSALLEALRALEPRLFRERMAELAYLANVLVAGQGVRLGEAAQRALAAVARGAELKAGRDRISPAQAVAGTPADVLFRLSAAHSTHSVLARGSPGR